mmetsp:Transcript_8860/g.26300  ORF Transcript_8860/g.26300 Transcript_8860/m.26300 type:complete len:241 (+) Transcript_8860:667-1389(+)
MHHHGRGRRDGRRRSQRYIGTHPDDQKVPNSHHLHLQRPPIAKNQEPPALLHGPEVFAPHQKLAGQPGHPDRRDGGPHGGTKRRRGDCRVVRKRRTPGPESVADVGPKEGRRGRWRWRQQQQQRTHLQETQGPGKIHPKGRNAAGESVRRCQIDRGGPQGSRQGRKQGKAGQLLQTKRRLFCRLQLYGVDRPAKLSQGDQQPIPENQGRRRGRGAIAGTIPQGRRIHVRLRPRREPDSGR